MPKVFLVPILSDNYVPVAVNESSRECVIIDPGQAAEVAEFVESQGLVPRSILLTHHHGDHIGGARALKKKYAVPVYAPLRERDDIPFADHYIEGGAHISSAGFHFEVMDLPGHTRGHIAYHEAEQGWLFSGDVIFSLGCGRIFEGTFQQHHESLRKIAALPPETWIFCAHEYTETNLKFCEAVVTPIIPGLHEFAASVRARRAEGKPTVPFQLKQELALNPFLRATSKAEFKTLREKRNQF